MTVASNADRLTPSRPHPDVIFYDGQCGLCHRMVRFVLARDHGAVFQFSPIGGAAFERMVPLAVSQGLTGSVVIVTADGRVLTRSEAVVYILRRLRGIWPRAARILGWVPRSVRDLGYDGVARVRRRVLATPAEACPVVPAEWQRRFI